MTGRPCSEHLPDAGQPSTERDAPANKIVPDDESYPGACCEANLNAKIRRTQVAAHAGPWYAHPGAEDPAETIRMQLGMN